MEEVRPGGPAGDAVPGDAARRRFSVFPSVSVSLLGEMQIQQQPTLRNFILGNCRLPNETTNGKSSREKECKVSSECFTKEQ